MRFGTSLSLSASGDVLVVRAPLDINGGGAVFVYEWDDASSLWSWGLGTASQSPSAIYGEVQGDNCGASVDISAAGTVIVVGANGSNVTGGRRGKAQIYSRNSNSWDKVGGDINGANDDFLGRRVAISADGNVVAASTDGPIIGYTRVFTWDDAVSRP